MSDNTTPRYRLTLEASSNGRVGKPTIIVLRADGSVWFTHKEDLADLAGMGRAARVMAARLEDTPEEVQRQLERAWAQLHEQHRQRQAEAAAAPEEGSASCVEVLLSLAGCASYCHGPDARPYATVPVGDGDDPPRETLCVRHESFRDWLRRRYYRETGGPSRPSRCNQPWGCWPPVPSMTAPLATSASACLGMLRVLAVLPEPRRPAV
jgi:alkylated DNA nucleotide flippase Atl1